MDYQKINVFRVAILSKFTNASPKVLALGLKDMLDEQGIDSCLFDIDILARSLSVFKKSNRYANWLHHLTEKFKYYDRDKKNFDNLKSFDLIIVSECCPAAFYNNYLDIEYLKRICRAPVALYEVFYLENTPYQKALLEKEKHYLKDRYNWHFAVSDTTEFQRLPNNEKNWSRIGLRLSHSNLTYKKKSSFKVLVDFEYQGNEAVRLMQLDVLKQLGIEYIELCESGRYSLNDIREIYNQSCVFFLQHIESFGVPIAEVLSTGCQVFTPSADWPMAWRIYNIDCSSYMPNFFTIYSDKDDLIKKLLEYRSAWDAIETPKSIFENFSEVYPFYYWGDTLSLRSSINHLCLGSIER